MVFSYLIQFVRGKKVSTRIPNLRDENVFSVHRRERESRTHPFELFVVFRFLDDLFVCVIHRRRKVRGCKLLIPKLLNVLTH
ncbi:hypothetical protein SDC9_186756 [bioreactor metagenome]|uniref:Uncharacterized protein n=1 Tax=bioreactor metagenome TaxID=1076179 RepID=A0A645HJN8_9ZZZZ